MEVQLIALYGRKDKKMGLLVNQTDGGEGHSGYIQSAALREQKSKKTKGIKKGPFTKTHRNNMAAAKRGKPGVRAGMKHSAIGIQNMSAAKQGTKHNFYGRKVPKKTAQKIGDSQRGERNHMFGKTHTKKIKALMTVNRIKTNIVKRFRAYRILICL